MKARRPRVRRPRTIHGVRFLPHGERGWVLPGGAWRLQRWEGSCRSAEARWEVFGPPGARYERLHGTIRSAVQQILAASRPQP